ncbi:cell wall protein PhiA [Pseudomassariella vexata]|uniref:Cell wall protein PhiA n=1 Tax=Pseudomassariella vexata TaxID=1141098 RepID=A0A1Y2E9L1_9PEZI|nr:cell wall protein PhiA [Pseudomassariella vexata]ORY68232.1 cell wall protein PhiA [Pseudomassariella vexata]
MQFKTLFAAAAAAATVTAQNTTTGSNSTTPAAFGVLSIRSGSELQYAAWQAANNGIFNLLPEQNASCDDAAGNYNSATFRIVDGELYLYSTENPPQYFYVDRSGMGQGKIGFTTGAEPAPKNAERAGWAVTASSQLQFDGAGFLACPGYESDAYEIWLAGISDHPGYNYNCTGVATRVVAMTAPVSCLYQS